MPETKNFLFEFGVLVEPIFDELNQEDEKGDEELEIDHSIMVLDLREVACFDKVKKIIGPKPECEVFKNVTFVNLKSSKEFVIFYPYRLFKKLMEQVFETEIVSLPHPN